MGYSIIDVMSIGISCALDDDETAMMIPYLFILTKILSGWTRDRRRFPEQNPLLFGVVAVVEAQEAPKQQLTRSDRSRCNAAAAATSAAAAASLALLFVTACLAVVLAGSRRPISGAYSWNTVTSAALSDFAVVVHGDEGVKIGAAISQSKQDQFIDETNPCHPSAPVHPSCADDRPYFEPAAVQVVRNKEGFPSFWNYGGHSPITVTYDGRSILLNGDRALFLGGSMHPSRATKQTWEAALDEAVHQGLNLITIYVIWAAHQPRKDRPFDWTLQTKHQQQLFDSMSFRGDDGEPSTTRSGSPWDLSQAIRAVANRGLFVHIRLGPYVCAEYSYGGIPEWLPLTHGNMSMRRPNQEWMAAMEDFVTKAVAYLIDNHLFAYQGGPIILAQIENELGGDVDAATENLVHVDDRHGNVYYDAVAHEQDSSVNESSVIRNATLQDYADWCGSLAQRLAPDVVWTMCSGLSANQTITTYNGLFDDISWMEHHGESGRIQVDQPALWTEDEGGFQIWGEEPNHPTDYFWGLTARSMALAALRWFARGGSHLNFYMWWGGYNRARSAAAGITNLYASDAPMCPSGERRHPKFDHFQSLLSVIQDVALVLLNSASALNHGEQLYVLDSDGSWKLGDEQLRFVYRAIDAADDREVIFVENTSNVSHTVQVPVGDNGEFKVLGMQAYSVVIFVDGGKIFDSTDLEASAKSFKRKFQYNPVELVDWVSWLEPIGAPELDPLTRKSQAPIEQTILNVESNVLSDYAWYETDLLLTDGVESASLFIDTQEANAFTVYIDSVYVGAADTHNHLERNVTICFEIGRLDRGNRTVSFLSESLGYSNLIGRWGASTKAKRKGITGSVILVIAGQNISLTDGRTWRSSAGLLGERPKVGGRAISRADLDSNLLLSGLTSPQSTAGVWSSALFHSPLYDTTMKSLFLDITSGRGHFWLNGNDLGRYWNITRGTTSEYSQRYYFFPFDFLRSDGQRNEIVFFDSFGGDHRDTRLLFSWVEPSDTETLEDEVDYPLACI